MDINQKDIDDLMICSIKAYLDILEEDNEGRNGLIFAVSTAHIINLLLMDIEIDKKDLDGKFALIYVWTY